MSTDLQLFLRETYPRARVELVRNGIRLPDDEDCRQEIRARWGVPEDAFWVGCVARLEPVKNLPCLIRAAAALGQTVPDLRVSIFGTGSQRSALEHLIRDLGAEEIVTLRGLRRRHADDGECVRLLRAAPRLHEGLPMSLLEAMALGIPPVCSRVGGMCELITPGKTGLLFESDNHGELASALARVHESKDFARRMGLAARQFVRESFAIEVTNAALLNVYRSLIPDSRIREANGGTPRMNRWVAEHLAYIPARRLQGQDVRKYERECEPNQFLGTAELQALRDRKIRALIAHAYRCVPYYRRLFDEAGIEPGTISGYDDLPRIPILTKRTILDHPGELEASPWRGRVFERKTSGSTGMTLHFKKEAEALARNDAVMFRCFDWYGIGLGDRQARFWGVPVAWRPRLREALKDLVANRIRVSAFDLSPSKCGQEFDRIRRFRPHYFYGYTSAIYAFATICTELGLPLNLLPLKAVICTAEKMYPHHRAALEGAFSCPVVDEYGSSENGVIAFQCRRGGMHMMSDHLAIEFVDGAGRPVGPGEGGRIAITDLSSYAMPLIRYEIGDVGASSAAVCDCGITLPLMDIVEGRKEDFIRTESGTLVHAAYLCYTLKDDAVREFKMYQKSPESFVVQIVKSPRFSEDTERALEARLRTALGARAAIRFEYLETIPRESSGKLRYFVSEVGDAGLAANPQDQPRLAIRS